MIVNSNKSIMNKKDYNLGIQILRVILSFMVVMDHFYNRNKLKKITYYLYYHIPTFFLISFFFSYNLLLSFNVQKIKLRIERLAIPYIVWSFIGFLLRNIYFYAFNKKSDHDFKTLVKHFITGHILNIVLWYLVILMLTTFVFIIIIFLFKNKYLSIFYILTIIAYISQYSGFNFYIHRKYLDHHAYLTFGRFAEAFPNAVTGFTLASFKIIEKLKKYRLKSIFYSLIILIMISKYCVFTDIKTFKYGNIRLNIAACCIFIFFSLLHVKNLEKKKLLNFIRQITSYTGGIYYMHYLVGNSLTFQRIFKSLKGTILLCIIIYVSCYNICHFSLKIFGKTKFKYIFI